MKLTFAVLFACWTIYSSSNAALSLPPSLIANAASFQPKHDHQHHAKAKRANLSIQSHKDVVDSPSPSPSPSSLASALPAERAANNEGGSIVQDSIIQHTAGVPSNLGETTEHHQRVSRMAEISSSASTTTPHLGQRQRQQQQQQQQYDLSEFLQAMKIPDDETSDNIDDDISQSMKALHSLFPPTQAQFPVQHHPPQPQPQAQAQADANEFFTPFKYWARHCQPDGNCPPQYYRALSANRNINNGASSLMHVNGLGPGNEVQNTGGYDGIAAMALSDQLPIDGISPMDDGNYIAINYPDGYNNNNNNNKNHNDNSKNNDISMFLNGEQDLIKFLRWAMHLLYQDKNVANYSANSAEFYHPGMYIWKKLNLSGRIEPPLFVEEPHYIIVRREQLNDDIKMNSKYNNNDPFIPPRGRKHNMPDLDALLNRYETFVPNRGKRDKIKDMLKSNDLFFPNRGKKQKPTLWKRDFEYENGRLRSSNGNTKATATATVRATNDAGNGVLDESKSSSSGNAAAADDDDDNADNDWDKAMPIALLMRDALGELMQEEEEEARLQLKADGDKITTKAHEINHLDNNNNRPQWLPSTLNYKFNGFDPSVEQSMPVAVAINGETREMSTPQKLAALTAAAEAAAAVREHALQQLLEQQQPIHVLAIDYGDGEPDAEDDRVDRGGTKIASNRWRSTRSMSTTMTQRQQKQQRRQQLKQRQQQKQRILRLMQQRRLMLPMPQNMNGEGDNQQQRQQNYHRQVKSYTNSNALLSRQLQLMQQDLQQQQQQEQQHNDNIQEKLHRLQRQRDPWPQGAPSLKSDAFDSPFAGISARAVALSDAFDSDYN